MRERHAWQHMAAKEFSRSRECEPSISGAFVRLNVWDYKRTEQSDHGRELRQHWVKTSCVFEVCENLTILIS